MSEHRFLPSLVANVALERTGEILRGTDLSTQLAELLFRLDIGIPRDVVPLARATGGLLTRAEYLQLHAAGVAAPEIVVDIGSEELAGHLGGDKRKASKIIRMIEESQQAA